MSVTEHIDPAAGDPHVDDGRAQAGPQPNNSIHNTILQALTQGRHLQGRYPVICIPNDTDTQDA
jgi:hypothetical protein